MDQDGPVDDFLVVCLDSIDKRLLEYQAPLPHQVLSRLKNAVSLASMMGPLLRQQHGTGSGFLSASAW
jgi:hypothetical protein